MSKQYILYVSVTNRGDGSFITLTYFRFYSMIVRYYENKTFYYINIFVIDKVQYNVDSSSFNISLFAHDTIYNSLCCYDTQRNPLHYR